VLRIEACILSAERSVWVLVSVSHTRETGAEKAGVITGQDRSSSSCLRLKEEARLVDAISNSNITKRTALSSVARESAGDR
jgi:hypothetical protein